MRADFKDCPPKHWSGQTNQEGPETNFKSENLNEKGFSLIKHQCVCSLSRENHHHNIVVDRDSSKIVGCKH